MLLGMIGPWQILIILVIGLFGILLPIFALIHIIKNDHLTTNEKIVWALVVFFFNILGSIIYFIAGRKQQLSS